ncbi:MAG TPA: hypothetical protein VF516_43585 [Kofleriaceae bacterium]
MRRRLVAVVCFLAACQTHAPRATRPDVHADVGPGGGATPAGGGATPAGGGATLKVDPRRANEIAADLFLLASNRVPSRQELAEASGALSAGQQELRAFVAGLVATDASTAFASFALFPWESNPGNPPQGFGQLFFELGTFEQAGQTVHFLTGGNVVGDSVVAGSAKPPCTLREAERVRPWWDPEHEILVCPSSHRPDRIRAINGKHKLCSPVTPEFERQGCGCGPSLMYCIKSERLDDISLSLHKEFNDTIAWAVGQDRPLQDVFRGRETVRDWLVEWLYRRQLVESGAPAERLSAAGWAPGRSPRPELHPGAHAGLLTSPQVALLGCEPRERLMQISNLIWCVKPRSVSVTADTVFKLPTNFRAPMQGWQLLASMPVCDGCHARMDYGAQFFAGMTAGFHYDSQISPHAGSTMSMFMNDQFDLRGKGEQTPAGFAELAVSQPEFGACMSQRVAAHVFGQHATADDVGSLLEVFKTRPTYRALLTSALVSYAERRLWSAGERGEIAHADPAAAQLGLGALVEQYCSDCHDAGSPAEKVWNSTRALADHGAMVQALDSIGDRRMPPARDPLDPAVRQRFVALLAERIWPDTEPRSAALDNYSGRLDNVEVHRRASTMKIIGALAGVDLDDAIAKLAAFYAGRGRDDQEYTPDFALNTVIDGVAACKRAGAKDVIDCVKRTTRLDAILPVAPR